MTRALSRTACLACLCLCMIAMLSGCLKFKQVVSVNPDGSGKMQIEYGISQQMLQMARGEDPFDDLEIDDMIEQEQNGWVAFTKPVIETKNGYKVATFTGYFEDINAAVFTSDDDDGDMDNTTYNFEAGKLTVTQPIIQQMANSFVNNPQMQEPQAALMLGQMIKGMEVSETYELPGDVQSASGHQVDGRTASASLVDKDMIPTPSKNIKAMANDDALTIEFTPGDVWIAGDQAAWQAELADAKAQWAQMKQQAGTDDD